MKMVGIREARQSLSALIKEVKHGRAIVITDRGQPVARLVPYWSSATQPLPDLAEFRRSMPVLTPPLSEAIVEERGARL